MKKILLFSVFLLMTAVVAAQKVKLSYNDYIFLTNSVRKEGGTYVIQVQEKYKVIPMMRNREPKGHEKSVKHRLELLRSLGTNVEYKMTHRSYDSVHDLLYYDDEYCYTPNKESALYQEYEARLKKGSQGELDFLHKGEKQKDGTYFLAVTDYYGPLATGSDNALSKNEKRMAERKAMISRHGTLVKSWSETKWGVGDVTYIQRFVYTLADDSFGSAQTVSSADMKKMGYGYLWIKGGFQWKELKWSGEVKDGKIGGEGEGICTDGKEVFHVKGKFHDGKPDGLFTYSWQDESVKDLEVEIFPFSEGMARIRVGNQWLYVREDGYTTLCKVPNPYRWSENGGITCTDFHDGHAIATYKWITFIIDKSGKVDVDDNKCTQALSALLDDSIAAMSSRFTTRNILGRIPNGGTNDFKNSLTNIFYRLEQMENIKWEQHFPSIIKKWDFYRDILETAETLNKTPEEAAWQVKWQAERRSYGVYDGLGTDWDWGGEDMKKRIETARRLLADPRFKLKDATAAATAKQNLVQLESAYTKAYDEVKAIRSSRRAALAAEKADRENRLSAAASSAEVDWERSTLPSGELQKAFLGGYWYYEKEGKIEFKYNGASIPPLRYNVECDSNGKVDVYSNGIGGKYKTRDAMIQDHLNKFKK